MLYYLQVGGPILSVLLIISIVALGIILERMYYFSKNKRYLSKAEGQYIVEALKEDNIEKAVDYAKKIKASTAFVMQNFLTQFQAGKTTGQYHEELRVLACEEVGKYTKYLAILQIIAFASPMLGMLGTVTGMIDSFAQIATQGSGNPQVVAEGISEALITTAAGLIIAIPVAVVYNVLNKKISDMEAAIDLIGTKIISIVGR